MKNNTEKSQSQLSADRVIKNQRKLHKLGQQLIKLQKKGTDKEFDKLKQTIEVYTKVTSAVGYLSQTYTGMAKTVLLEERLNKFVKKYDMMRKILPKEIFDKYWNEAHEIIVNEQKTAIPK